MQWSSETVDEYTRTDMEHTKRILTQFKSNQEILSLEIAPSPALLQLAINYCTYCEDFQQNPFLSYWLGKQLLRSASPSPLEMNPANSDVKSTLSDENEELLSQLGQIMSRVIPVCFSANNLDRAVSCVASGQV